MPIITEPQACHELKDAAAEMTCVAEAAARNTLRSSAADACQRFSYSHSLTFEDVQPCVRTCSDTRAPLLDVQSCALLETARIESTVHLQREFYAAGAGLVAAIALSALAYLAVRRYKAK